MKKYYDILKVTPLFRDIEEVEITGLLDCLNAKPKSFSRGEAIFLAGDAVSDIGIVCSGAVQVVKEDFLGNRNILTKLGVGDLFGESFACARTEKLPVSVFATRDSHILFVDYRKIIITCPSACKFHQMLIENMLGILAAKNVMLNQKIEMLSKRATRDKLISYLSAQSQNSGSSHFAIPFNRQELADFLCIDRSAMSRELCKLRDEGLLSFDRSDFVLLGLEKETL